ncbi:FkbM family methyltransferase [Pyrococcus kukulkanii]|uniref:FkbM family methyltransferase n=1 Tax=Pyrococcus kukulkanii TaxID=1609559 RepID=UPI003561450C
MIKKIIGFIGNSSLYVGVFIPKKIVTDMFIKLNKLKGVRFLSVPIRDYDSNISFDIIIDLDDEGLARELLYANIREREVVREVVNILRNNNIRTIIDIGANVGFYVLIEGYSSNKDATIYAIEPVMENFKVLKMNIALNNLDDRVRPLNLAIGDKNTNVEIKVPKKRNWATIKNITDNIEYHTEQIEMVTLETLFKRENIPPKDIFLRFDIEGYEYELILGNRKFLEDLENVYIEFELHHRILGVDKTLEIIDILKELGFDLLEVVVIYHHHIYSLPRVLQKIGEKCIKMRTFPLRFGEVDHNISYSELKRRIRDGEYKFNPHLLLKK